MFCTNCGYDLSKKDIERIKKEISNSSKNGSKVVRTKDTNLTYICPKCGHIIKEGLNEEDVKALSRASHSEIHRSRNIINGGMAAFVISLILAVIGYMFYLMSFKANAGGYLVTDCTEFYVFISLISIAAVGFVYAFVSLFLGIRKNRKYSLLLKDIQNNIFVQ